MNVTLKSVYAEDWAAKKLYELLRERTEEESVNISHRKLPAYRDHLRYYRSRPYRRWYFVKVDGEIAGNCTLSHLNEIGIVLLRAYRGKGVGRLVIRRLIFDHKPLAAIPGKRQRRWIANINPQNERSIATFEECGFRHIQNTYAL